MTNLQEQINSLKIEIKRLNSVINIDHSELNQLTNKFNAHRDRKEIHYKVNIIEGGKKMKNESKTEYELFHISRINNVLLDQQTPRNSYNEGLSDAGNFMFETDKDKVNRILDSLYELGLITMEQRNSIRGLIT